jgi:hypothetical protein
MLPHGSSINSSITVICCCWRVFPARPPHPKQQRPGGMRQQQPCKQARLGASQHTACCLFHAGLQPYDYCGLWLPAPAYNKGGVWA